MFKKNIQLPELRMLEYPMRTNESTWRNAAPLKQKQIFEADRQEGACNLIAVLTPTSSHIPP